jgi:hypothetical protein
MRHSGHRKIDIGSDRALTALLASFGVGLALHVRGDREWRIKELYYWRKVISAAEMTTLLDHLEDIRAEEAEKAWAVYCEESETLDLERGCNRVPGPLPAPPLEGYG